MNGSDPPEAGAAADPTTRDAPGRHLHSVPDAVTSPRDDADRHALPGHNLDDDDDEDDDGDDDGPGEPSLSVLAW
ncbi:hypothetical protein [Mycobacterium parmense]|uniref:Uncharacterized protein n=1 Tax=Mycobacterium parmense TaxID=185642 RepID=A0A7I7YPF0_9MYCO|nr:hypothetical protein [Mycobacterium parmense]MCV7349607.1 hypothetical protein [Mycobacterium parmense]ORW58893.1 hypothetical protein AWC20_11215 [Mycobacterium parmense]BBZ43758.1 hypothetical protein MPRM_10390 [Mycobacterium parmense]